MQTMQKPNPKEKIKGKEEDQEVIMVKTTMRIPKTLLKQLKQYGLDNDMTVTQVAMKAFTDLLNNKDKS